MQKRRGGRIVVVVDPELKKRLRILSARVDVRSTQERHAGFVHDVATAVVSIGEHLQNGVGGVVGILLDIVTAVGS